MLPINCDVVGILIKRHASPFVNDTSNYQKKQTDHIITLLHSLIYRLRQ